MKKVLAILFLLITLFGIFYFYKFNPEKKEQPFVTCMLKKVSGYDCPGCGGQRAFHQLLNLNIVKAAKLNLLIFVLAPLLLYIILTFCLEPFGIQLPPINISIKTTIIFFIFIIIYMILRNLPHYPFTLLKS